MLVSGYEHQTWQCSGCSSVEQRMTFTRTKSQTYKAPPETVSVEPTQTATDELIQIEPAEPAAAVSIQPAPVISIQVEQTVEAELSPTTPVETTVSAEATNEPEPPTAKSPQMSTATLQTGALPTTIDERLRYLTKRATALKEAAAQDKRRAEFNRDWDHLPSAPSTSSWPKPSGQKRSDDGLRPSAVSAAAQAPTAHDEPISPDRAGRWSWRQFLRYGRRKGSSG